MVTLIDEQNTRTLGYILLIEVISLFVFSAYKPKYFL